MRLMKTPRMVVPAIVRLVRVVCLASVCASSLLFGVRGASADALPVLSITQDSYDFGTVAQGTVVVHEFEVRNSGSADLVIHRIVPSCGCTAATVVSPTIKPGTSEKVRVAFDTSGFMGPKTKTVQIVTNDSQNTDRVLTLKGSVRSGFIVEPSRLSFGELSRSSTLSDRQRDVTIQLADGDALEISKASALSRYVTVSAVEKQARVVRARVEISPEAPRGEFRDRIIFELTGGRSATINVPVTATIAGDVRVSASTVSFGVVADREIVERRVQFENRAEAPVSIMSLTSSESAITPSYIEVQPGKQGVLVFKLDPTKMTNDIRGVVEVTTNHPTEGNLSINVTAVRPPR